MDKAHEQGNEGMSVLKKPFRIELRKTAVLASYRTKVIGVSGNCVYYSAMYQLHDFIIHVELIYYTKLYMY